MNTPVHQTSFPLPRRHNKEPNVGQNERIACVVGGLMIAAFGLARRNASTPILTFLGGLLIRRGVTGQCEAYKKLGVDTNVRLH